MPEGRCRVVLLCPTPVAPSPSEAFGTPAQQTINALRPSDDMYVDELLDLASVTVVADFTPWCPEPNDHCVGGDCYYGNHGPLTDEAELDLRAGGYGWVLDDEKETN